MSPGRSCAYPFFLLKFFSSIHPWYSIRVWVVTIAIIVILFVYAGCHSCMYVGCRMSCMDGG